MPETSAEFMQRLDGEYRVSSGLAERRFYSIFYSQINPSRVLVLGFNPGGDPETWCESALASRSYYENGEHEYLDCHYSLAVAMRKFLVEVLPLTSDEEIRQIPKSNIIFRRSRSSGELRLSERAAILDAKPILDQIIERVAPCTVILEGISTLKKFEKYYCEDVVECVDGIDINTPNGRHSARIYRADRAVLSVLQTPIKLLGIGHPSKFSGRDEWSKVRRSAKEFLAQE